jgi:GNAT superfamily N-acetyltransferase
MLPINQQEIDRYWATEMGTGSNFMRNTSEVICTAQQLYSGVQLFHRDGFLVIASPQHLVDFITTSIHGLPVRNIFSVEFVGRLLGSGIERILGPAHASYADSSTFNPSPIVFCRLLTPEDSAICQSFTEALSAAEIDQTGFDFQEGPAFGAFANGVLCAIASYQIWEPRIAHITVATHPDYRRRGYGRVAVSALAQHAFARNLILQYRALASNENSRKLGHSLGFQQYCSTIYARLSMASQNSAVTESQKKDENGKPLFVSRNLI